jgi:hypothetical protein
MNKKIIVSQIVDSANDLEELGFVNLASRLTDMAARIAYDFNNPQKEELVDDSFSNSDNEAELQRILKEMSDSDKVSDDQVKHILDIVKDGDVSSHSWNKENIVDDSFVNDFSFDDEDEQKDDSNMSEDEWNSMFHTYIVDGDITRSQIEETLSVILSENPKYQKFIDNSEMIVKYMSKYYDKTDKILTLEEVMEKIDKLFGDKMDMMNK